MRVPSRLWWTRILSGWALLNAAAGCSRLIGADDVRFERAPLSCAKQADCNTFHDDGPHACISGSCRALLGQRALEDGSSAECAILGRGNLQSTLEPFVFGALGEVRDGALGVASQDFELAVDEFTSRGGMVVGGEPRLPIGVVCNSYGVSPRTLDRTLDHLALDLDLDAILMSVGNPAELRRSFERLYREQNRDVFLLSPFQSDELLANLDDDGLVWQMLGDPRVIAEAYPPLIRRVERYLNPENGGDARPPLRVALVESNVLPYLDVAGVVDATLFVNGKTASENGPNYRRFHFDGGAGDDAILSELVEFTPDVVIAVMAGEFVKMLYFLEQRFASESPRHRPFYVLSPAHAVHLAELPSEQLLDLRTRVAGVNSAGAEDQEVYQAYVRRFEAAYPETKPSEGHENFYDAAYFLLYAAAAAAGPNPGGLELAQGMLRLMSGTPVAVGGDYIPRALEHLKEPGGSIALQGSLGPPNFDATGARRGTGSVWCIAQEDGAVSFHFDVLRVDEASGELRGNFDCYPL